MEPLAMPLYCWSSLCVSRPLQHPLAHPMDPSSVGDLSPRGLTIWPHPTSNNSWPASLPHWTSLASASPPSWTSSPHSFDRKPTRSSPNPPHHTHPPATSHGSTTSAAKHTKPSSKPSVRGHPLQPCNKPVVCSSPLCGARRTCTPSPTSRSSSSYSTRSMATASGGPSTVDLPNTTPCPLMPSWTTSLSSSPAAESLHHSLPPSSTHTTTTTPSSPTWKPLPAPSIRTISSQLYVAATTTPALDRTRRTPHRDPQVCPP